MFFPVPVWLLLHFCLYSVHKLQRHNFILLFNFVPYFFRHRVRIYRLSSFPWRLPYWFFSSLPICLFIYILFSFSNLSLCLKRFFDLRFDLNLFFSMVSNYQKRNLIILFTNPVHLFLRCYCCCCWFFLAMFAIKRSQRKTREINETSSTYRINHIVVELRLKYFDRYWYRNPSDTDYNTIGSTIFSTLLWCWMNKDRQNEISHKCLLSCALHAMLKSTHFFLLSAVQLNCAHVNPFRLLHGCGFYAFEHWMHTIINKSSIQTIGFNRGFRLQLCYAFFIWLVFSLSLCCFL